MGHCPILLSLCSLEEGGKEETRLDGEERICEESERRSELRGCLSALIHLLSQLKGPTCRQLRSLSSGPHTQADQAVYPGSGY